MNFTYQSSQKSIFIIISLDGELLDKSFAADLLKEVDRLISEQKNNLVVDLANLKHINSNGLNVLINILTKARSAGGDVIIANVPEKIKSLLVITKLNTVFTVADSTDAAIGMLENQAKQG